MIVYNSNFCIIKFVIEISLIRIGSAFDSVFFSLNGFYVNIPCVKGAQVTCLLDCDSWPGMRLGCCYLFHAIVSTPAHLNIPYYIQLQFLSSLDC